MSSSIYHFFKFIVENKDSLRDIDNIENLDFDDSFVSSTSKGLFPDLAIKLNVEDDFFKGGELIEFKGSKSYNISSFNSTIPTGTKAISEIIQSKKIKEQMIKAGNNIESLPYRDVYYLISGKNNNEQKIVLVHGSFFETIPVKNLIREAFLKVIKDADPDMSNDRLEELSKLFIEQKLFSQVRRIDGASVKIRFRIMTEVETKANLLNSEYYPQIKPNTISLCIPYDSVSGTLDEIVSKFHMVFHNWNEFSRFELKHEIDGSKYMVFQTKDNDNSL